MGSHIARFEVLTSICSIAVSHKGFEIHSFIHDFSPFVWFFYDEDTVGMTVNRLLYPELFYLQSGLWIISHDPDNRYDYSLFPMNSEKFQNSLYSGTEIHKYHTQVYTEGILRYEGALSVDLPVTALNNQLEPEWTGDYYSFRTNAKYDLNTWITLTVE